MVLSSHAEHGRAAAVQGRPIASEEPELSAGLRWSSTPSSPLERFGGFLATDCVVESDKHAATTASATADYDARDLGNAVMNALGKDGYMRLTLDEVLSVQFEHLVSGLDEDGEVAVPCGAPTTISGYTEWVGQTDPPLTVGWDWVVEPGRGNAQWRRVGLPRTNVLLVDCSSGDFDWHISLEVLGTVVDTLAWQDQTKSAIEMRYT